MGYEQRAGRRRNAQPGGMVRPSWASAANCPDALSHIIGQFLERSPWSTNLPDCGVEK